MIISSRRTALVFGGVTALSRISTTTSSFVFRRGGVQLLSFKKMSFPSSASPAAADASSWSSSSSPPFRARNHASSANKPINNSNIDIGHPQQTSKRGGSSEASMSDYERLVRRLYTTNLFNPVKLGLENMDRLHEMLGRPMDRPEIIVVHVAGSNGKGSVALKTAHALERYGEVKVGLFVSPHISSFRERIQIDGAPISESQVVVHLREIFDICDAGGIAATFFEVTTALAFRIFDEEGVDVVVLETGLGGRLDATNVIRRPALSVITSIGLEHTKILGDTIELIAIEKGGIMKRGCPALLGRNTPFDVLRRCAEERGVSRLFTCDDVLGPAVGPTLTSLEDYDVENSRIATAAIRLLQSHREMIESGGKRRVKLLSSEEIAKGVQIRPPCRFEELDVPVSIPADDGGSSQVTKVVRVILDVAHNPQAMDYLIVKLRANYPNVEKLRVVLGMSADKDLKYCTDILLNHVGHHPEKIHLVEASHPRAASISSIREANPQLVGCHYCIPKEDDLNLDGRDESSVSKQVRSALQLAAANDEIVVVCGTVFIMADAREELGIVEPRDSAVIAAVAGAGFRSSQENFDDGDTKKA